MYILYIASGAASARLFALHLFFQASVSGSWPLRGSSAPVCEAEKSIASMTHPVLD